MLDKLQGLTELRDVATDQQIAGTTATLTIDRDAAARFGIQPQRSTTRSTTRSGSAQVTQYFTQLNSYYVILEVPPKLRGRRWTRCDKLYVKRPPATAVPLSTLVKVDTAPSRAARGRTTRASSRR